MIHELCLLRDLRVAAILTFHARVLLFQLWPRIIQAVCYTEVLNVVSAETAVSSGVFHSLCVAMQTAFLAQGIN